MKMNCRIPFVWIVVMVALFVLTKGGPMYEAAIGGQKFSFTPKSE